MIIDKTSKQDNSQLELQGQSVWNIFMDVLGGCSKDIEQNIKEFVGDKCEWIKHQMQKALPECLSWVVRYQQKFWTYLF